MVRNDSFLFHTAHRLWFPITVRFHFITIRSLFIYLTLATKAFRQNGNENYLQLSHTQEQTDNFNFHQSENTKRPLTLILIYFLKMLPEN